MNQIAKPTGIMTVGEPDQLELCANKQMESPDGNNTLKVNQSNDKVTKEAEVAESFPKLRPKRSRKMKCPERKVSKLKVNSNSTVKEVDLFDFVDEESNYEIYNEERNNEVCKNDEGAVIDKLDDAEQLFLEQLATLKSQKRVQKNPREKIMRYSDDQMELAVSAVKKGMSKKLAAKTFNVPRTTLVNRLDKGNKPDRMGRPTILSLLEEKELVRWIENANKRGVFPTMKVIFNLVESIITGNGRPNPFKDNRPGPTWWRLFIKRHPDLMFDKGKKSSKDQTSATELQVTLTKETQSKGSSEQIVCYPEWMNSGEFCADGASPGEKAFDDTEADHRKRKYSDTDMLAAMTAVKRGMSQRMAASLFGVPHTTLSDKLVNRYDPLKTKPGPQSTLAKEQEGRIASCILHLSKIGYSLMKIEVPELVKSFLDRDNINCPPLFRDNKPSHQWVNRLLQRNPELSNGLPQLFGHQKKCTPDVVCHWFNEFSSFLHNEHSIDAEKFLVEENAHRIFNVDEYRFPLLLAENGLKFMYVNGLKNKSKCTPDNELQINILTCTNAVGDFSVPLIVFPMIYRDGNIQKEKKSEYEIAWSSNGWIDGDSFLQWLSNVFYPSLTTKEVKFPVVLFLDGLSCHLNVAAIEFCIEHEIILFCFPANSSNIMQPLNMSISGILKKNWNHAVKEFSANYPEGIFNCDTFFTLFKDVWNKCIENKDVITLGFKKSRILPVDSQLIYFSKLSQISPGNEGKSSEENTENCQNSQQSPVSYQRNDNTNLVGLNLALDCISKALPKERLDIFVKRFVDGVDDPLDTTEGWLMYKSLRCLIYNTVQNSLKMSPEHATVDEYASVPSKVEDTHKFVSDAMQNKFQPNYNFCWEHSSEEIVTKSNTNYEHQKSNHIYTNTQHRPPTQTFASKPNHIYNSQKPIQLYEINQKSVTPHFEMPIKQTSQTFDTQPKPCHSYVTKYNHNYDLSKASYIQPKSTSQLYEVHSKIHHQTFEMHPKSIQSHDLQQKQVHQPYELQHKIPTQPFDVQIRPVIQPYSVNLTEKQFCSSYM